MRERTKERESKRVRVREKARERARVREGEEYGPIVRTSLTADVSQSDGATM